MDYPNAIRFLDSLVSEAKPTGDTMKLERITLLLNLMGNPQSDFKSIHVVGTAGKGSVATISYQVLLEHGFKAGLHVSPHMQVVNERMQVNGLIASRGDFAKLAEEVESLCPKVEAELDLGKPTYFEAALAMTFRHFQKEKVDYAVIEAGLGGKFDGTNVLKPNALVVTNVSLDHTKFLGNTIKQIALDKAGAVKQETPVVTGCNGTALQVLREVCGVKNAPLEVMGVEFASIGKVRSSPSGNDFAFRLNKNEFHVHQNVIGPVQADNFILAAAALGAAGVILRQDAIETAARNLFIPCRFEVVNNQRPMVVLDGAHNPSKIKALAKALDLFKEEKVGVVAIAKDKDAKQMLNVLKKRFRKIIFTRVDGKREFWDPAELREIAGVGAVELQPELALMLAMKEAGQGMVVGTGSFYLTGLLRQHWLSNEGALLRRSLRF